MGRAQQAPSSGIRPFPAMGAVPLPQGKSVLKPFPTFGLSLWAHPGERGAGHPGKALAQFSRIAIA